jgi:hypothetical protein
VLLTALSKSTWGPYLWLVLAIAASSASFGEEPKKSTVPNKNGRVEFQVLDSATGYMVDSATIKWEPIGESAPR